MRVLLVHPSRLMMSEVFLCLEPLGLERVAAATVAAGHEVRIVDLQVFSHRDYQNVLRDVHARMPVGLLVLQRLDVLCAQGRAPIRGGPAMGARGPRDGSSDRLDAVPRH